MRRLNIVVGYKADGEPEVIYIGQSGEKADEAFSAAGAPEFTAAEMFKSPMAAKRRRFEAVPDSGTAEAKTEKPAKEPKAPKPKKPSKAELKKAEKEAETAAQESETATEDDKPEF